MQGKSGMLKVLVVEDEAIAAMAIAMMLEELGCSIAAVAGSGEQALATAAQTAPDFIIMDIRLRGAMNGIETAMELRKSRRIPVVFTSAYSETALGDLGDLQQEAHFIGKPVTEQALQQVVEQIRTRLQGR